MDKRSHLFHITVKETEKIIDLNTEITSLKNFENFNLAEFVHFLKDATKIERINNDGYPKRYVPTHHLCILHFSHQDSTANFTKIIFTVVFIPFKYL